MKLIDKVLSFLPENVQIYIRAQESKYFNVYKIKKWERSGCPIPPVHEVKQREISRFASLFRYKTFVETGTFLGAMMYAQYDNFERLISVELDLVLYTKAINRFRNYPKISIYNGDSGLVLFDLMRIFNEPSIFWLDGHYSGVGTAKGAKECPIFEEIKAIFDNSSLNHILLIDDARLFIGENDYPTLSELEVFVRNYRSSYIFEVKYDIIQIYPKILSK